MTTATLSAMPSSNHDADAVRAGVDAVLNEPLYWFPVRHHSPAVARQVEAAILARRPQVIFLEAPAEANALVPHIVDRQTRPPVAIYSSYRDDDNVLGLAGIASPAADVPARFTAWYPMLSYSPEYVALQAARQVGADVVFMDLPHYARLRPRAAADDRPEAAPDATAAPGPSQEPSSTAADDRLIVESGFYRALAAGAGYRSWDEAWDTLFEQSESLSYEAFRRELAAFCCAARLTTSLERIAADDTLDRERFMLGTIRRTLAERQWDPSSAMVVCGGFHLFLDRQDVAPPPAPPAGTVHVTLVPYSFFRVSELSGYAAGNRAPQFYQTMWDLDREGRGDDLLAEHATAVLKEARRAGDHVSSADAIAVAQHARLLANLRGRREPILDDMHEALIACCCKGDPDEAGIYLRRAIDAVAIGTRVGRVTSALGRLPIVDDFHRQLEDLELVEAAGHERRVLLELDKRDPLAARRSAFLQRLRFLKCPLAAPAESPAADFATGTMFRERWHVRWSPQIEPALIEQSLYGDTVAAATLARLRDELAGHRGQADAACERLARAIDMDLPEMVPAAEEACGLAIDSDPRFTALAQALAWLLAIDRQAVFRNLQRAVLADLIERAYDRACFALADAATAPQDQQAAVVAALLTLAEPVLRGDRGLDQNLLVENVRGAADLTAVPFLRGAFLGLLAELRHMTAEQLADELRGLARSGVERMVTAGDFLEGVLAVSRSSIVLGADALVAAVDDLLRAADWETFLVMLPRLRAAFTRLHARQVESVAERVSERYGLADRASLTALHTSLAAAARIAELDRRVAEIEELWNL